jgi:RHS repeat-associated protein
VNTGNVQISLDGGGGQNPDNVSTSGFDLTPSSLSEGAHSVRVTADNAAGQGQTEWSFFVDSQVPTVTLTAGPSGPTNLLVSWSGSDSAPSSGILGYDVQYKVGSSPSWTPWLTGTTETSALFQATLAQTYTFQARVRDLAGNVSGWVETGVVEVSPVTKYYLFGGQRVAMRQGSQVYYLHGDHLGSTSLTTDQSGAVVAQVRYLPYGEERWSTGALPTDFGFTGQRQEAGFGLMDYNARYYAPGLGRFISPDSLIPNPKSSQGFNRYRYARNNPLEYVDPSGHYECEDNAPEKCNIPPKANPNGQSKQRPTVQPAIDVVNRGSNGLAWPMAVVGQTTNIVEGGLGSLGNGQIVHSWNSPPSINLLPSSTIREVPTAWAKASTVGSYGLPIVGGGLNAVEIQLRLDAGEITTGQAGAEQVANVGFTTALAFGGGSLIPAAAATTSNPVGWSVAGSVSLAYDVSIAQGTFNNAVEGQPLDVAFTNARAETNRSFGIGWFDSAAYEVLNPVLAPALTPIAQAMYTK